MISVTTEAKDLLQEILDQAGEEAGVEIEEIAVRLAPSTPEEDSQSGQVSLGLVIDRPKEQDETVEHNGRTILAVDPAVVELVDGLTMDKVDTPEGPRLTITQ